jgi:predicted ArsR family transcriptional regulator
MLDERDRTLLHRLATTHSEPADGTALADDLGLPDDETTDHLWHLQSEGLANAHLTGKRLTWSLTGAGRTQAAGEA